MMRELDSPKSLMEQEQAIQKVVLSKLQRSTVVQPRQQEAISYRLAEIFVAARQLYTDVLPSFLDLPDKVASEEDDQVFEVFGEVRMNILNLRDLLEDFEEAFLESLSGRLGIEPHDKNEDQDDAEEEDGDVI